VANDYNAKLIEGMANNMEQYSDAIDEYLYVNSKAQSISGWSQNVSSVAGEDIFYVAIQNPS